MSVEVVYLSWNRRAMSEASFRLLHRNTNWELVSKLVVYDDGSEDGTDGWLEQAGKQIGVPGFEMRRVRFRAPAATMNDFLATTEADLFAKVDSDIAVPPGWLDVMLGVMERNPWLELLGAEAGRTGPFLVDVPPDSYGVELGSHIGGVGLMRTKAFHSRRSIMARGRFGFTEWQHQHNPDRGWLSPDIPMVQLDRIPEEPWASLTDEYVKLGYARRWPKYDALVPDWWNWIARQVRLPEAA